MSLRHQSDARIDARSQRDRQARILRQEFSSDAQKRSEVPEFHNTRSVRKTHEGVKKYPRVPRDLSF